MKRFLHLFMVSFLAVATFLAAACACHAEESHGDDGGATTTDCCACVCHEPALSTTDTPLLASARIASGLAIVCSDHSDSGLIDDIFRPPLVA